jgi:hypothetical protein
MTAFAALPVSCRSLTETTLVRLVCLTAFLADFGPRRRIAQICGSSFGRRAPVLLNRLMSAGLGVRVRCHGAFQRRNEAADSGQPRLLARHSVIGSLKPMSLLAKKEIGDHPAGWQICRLGGRRLRRSRPPFLLSVR